MTSDNNDGQEREAGVDQQVDEYWLATQLAQEATDIQH
jgi:hypothetical protein